MIRGKGAEFSFNDFLKEKLDKKTWEVEKENINAQPNLEDEDNVVIHKSTNTRIIIESKSAVRGSFRLGLTKRVPITKFQVKCHKSRSTLGKKTNDKYLVSAFDLVVTNPSNAIITKKQFIINHDPKIVDFLEKYYKVLGVDEIFIKACNDWRFTESFNIADSRGVIQRTPHVQFENDPHWKDFTELENTLLKIVKRKAK